MNRKGQEKTEGRKGMLGGEKDNLVQDKDAISTSEARWQSQPQRLGGKLLITFIIKCCEIRKKLFAIGKQRNAKTTRQSQPQRLGGNLNLRE